MVNRRNAISLNFQRVIQELLPNNKLSFPVGAEGVARISADGMGKKI